MIPIDNLDRTGEVFVHQIPDPMGAIANGHDLFSAYPNNWVAGMV
jgi:hypothetical protein